MANDAAKPKMELTPREKEIVLLVVSGEKRSNIAHSLSVHINTVNFHLCNARRKLGVQCTLQLVVWATRANGSLSH